MIKICKWLYINPLTIVLFALCFITRKLEYLMITYSVMFLHECAHLAAAFCIGLKPSYIAFQPFGVNLKLKNRLVYALADEIILYLSGPLINIILSIICAFIYRKTLNTWAQFMYIQNFLLFVTNMLPIVPLDGGIILKKIILHKIGYKKADRIMICISCIFVGLILLLGIRIFWQQRNFTVLFLLIFVIGNIFTQKEKYNIDFIKELMFYQEKEKKYKKQNIKFLVYSCDANFRDIAKQFNVKDFFVVFLLTGQGAIDDIVTEIQIIDKLMDREYSVLQKIK